MIDLGHGVRLVTRAEWRARAPRSTTGITPSFGVTAHWEGPHMGWPWDHSACASLVRGIQAYHMDHNGWSDVAYTLLACGHSYVFEGRGVGRRTAANGTNHGNSVAYAVCYLGGQGDPFTAGGQQAMRTAMDWLQRHGAGPGRNGHRDWKPTACPGDEIYRWVHAGPSAGVPSPSRQEDWFTMATKEDLRAVVREAMQAELTVRGDRSRTAIMELAHRGARDALGYFATRDGKGPVQFVLAGVLRIPVEPQVRRWADGLRAVAGDGPAQVVAVPAGVWDAMAVLGE